MGRGRKRRQQWLKMPTAGHTTYCGFWDGFVENPKTNTVTSMGQNMTIQTTFQHSGSGLATINTFDVQGVGATTSGGIGIANDGIAISTSGLMQPTASL
jgi:hypothetical protein